MPFTSNRFVLVDCYKIVDDNVVVTPGIHINVDVVGLDPLLVEAMKQYEILPNTPQYSFGEDRPTMYLRWDTAEEAISAAYPWGLWEFSPPEVGSVPVA